TLLRANEVFERNYSQWSSGLAPTDCQAEMYVKPSSLPGERSHSLALAGEPESARVVRYPHDLLRGTSLRGGGPMRTQDLDRLHSIILEKPVQTLQLGRILNELRKALRRIRRSTRRNLLCAAVEPRVA